jgi:hypothetical protein
MGIPSLLAQLTASGGLVPTLRAEATIDSKVDPKKSTRNNFVLSPRQIGDHRERRAVP